MKPIQFENGAIEVDAALVAQGFGIAPPLLLQRLRERKISAVCERGTDADAGRYRLTFFSATRRFRLVVDETGAVLQRSAINFGDAPLPEAARRPAR